MCPVTARRGRYCRSRRWRDKRSRVPAPSSATANVMTPVASLAPVLGSVAAEETVVGLGRLDGTARTEFGEVALGSWARGAVDHQDGGSRRRDSCRRVGGSSGVVLGAIRAHGDGFEHDLELHCHGVAEFVARTGEQCDLDRGTRVVRGRCHRDRRRGGSDREVDRTVRNLDGTRHRVHDRQRRVDRTVRVSVTVPGTTGPPSCPRQSGNPVSA